MQNVFWQTGQRVIKQILDWLQQSKENAIATRIQDVYSDGVVDGLLDNMNILGKDLSPTLTDFFHIQVDTGVAYKTNSVTGNERILISNNSIPYDTSVGQINSLNHTTDNGSGSPLNTPRSTGSFNIPVAAAAINYVYIAYLQTVDDSVFTLHKINNTKIFYKTTDGYDIEVNTTGINPDPTRFILLGTVNCSGSQQAVAANISIAGRPHFRTTKLRVGIETNNVGITDRPATYATGNLNLSLDDHIKSVGTGPVSPINPHGLSANDLGLTEDQLVRSHRQNEHQNGIIAGSAANPAPTTSGLYAAVVIVFPHNGHGPGPFYDLADYVNVQPLLGGEFAIINGLAFSNATFPTPVPIYFNDGITIAPTGTYQIYFDSTTGTVGKTTTPVVGDTTKLWLSTVSWDSGSMSLSGFIDRRRFGTLQRLTRWYTAGRPQGGELLLGMFGYNLDVNKLEYYNGTIWVQL